VFAIVDKKLGNKQEGAPYILSVIAGKPFEDQRSQGYTVAVHSVFSCKEDMVYVATKILF
jgi:hypothetical protein